MLTNLFANCHCSSGDVLREGAWIFGTDEMRSRDLMVCGRGEANTEEPVCSTAEGRRDRSSICLAFVVNFVDDLKRRQSWFSWDDGEREIRLNGI